MNRISTKELIEGIGILGIILSLIFVGLELRQNSTVARLEAHQSFVSNIVDINSQNAHDPEFSAILRRAFDNQGYEEFDEIEQAQLYSFYIATVHAYYGLFISIEEGILPSRYNEVFPQVALFNNNFFRTIWQGMGNNFEDDFVLFFEAQPWNT